jgi:hypothetical protein
MIFFYPSFTLYIYLLKSAVIIPYHPSIDWRTGCSAVQGHTGRYPEMMSGSNLRFAQIPLLIFWYVKFMEKS